MTTQSFAKRFCALSVKAARSANRLAIVCRTGAEPDAMQAAIFREIAKANIREAKERKQAARAAGEW